MLIAFTAIVPLIRKKATIIAKPIADSAAAIAIIEIVNISPIGFANAQEQVKNKREVASNMSSTHIIINIRWLRLITTPKMLNKNSMIAIVKYSIGIILILGLLVVIHIISLVLRLLKIKLLFDN